MCAQKKNKQVDDVIRGEKVLCCYFQKVIYWICEKGFGIIGKELTYDTFQTIMQFIKFGIVGVSNTVISYVIYVVGLVLLQRNHFLPQFDYLFAQAVAFVLSVLWSFYWNNKMVFTLEAGKKRSLWRALVKTFISYSFTGLFLSSILLFLWVKVLRISEFIAPLINLMFSVPLNFIINKFWSFKQT